MSNAKWEEQIPQEWIQPGGHKSESSALFVRCSLTNLSGLIESIATSQYERGRAGLIEEVKTICDDFSESTHAESEYERGAQQATRLFRKYLLKNLSKSKEERKI